MKYSELNFKPCGSISIIWKPLGDKKTVNIYFGDEIIFFDLVDGFSSDCNQWISKSLMEKKKKKIFRHLWVKTSNRIFLIVW